jgi:hypothetical protein
MLAAVKIVAPAKRTSRSAVSSYNSNKPPGPAPGTKERWRWCINLLCRG